MFIRHFSRLHRYALVSILLMTIVFSAPITAATSQCTTITTTQSPVRTVVRTFTYILFGTVSGNWTAAYSFMFHGMTYNVTINTQCAPR